MGFSPSDWLVDIVNLIVNVIGRISITLTIRLTITIGTALAKRKQVPASPDANLFRPNGRKRLSLHKELTGALAPAVRGQVRDAV